MSKQKERRFNVAMRNIQDARKDVADVLSVVDYDFDQAKRHEEHSKHTTGCGLL